MQRLRIFPLLLIFNLAAVYADQPTQTRTFVIPAGTQISVRNNQEIDSSTAGAGQTFAAQVTNDVRDSHGAVLIPHGANAQVVIQSSSRGGKVKGTADLVVALHSVSVAGHRYTVHATAIREEGSKGLGKNKRTGKYVGGGAAGGGIIGAIAGGGKGALLGGALGAGAGVAAQSITKRRDVKIPAETLMTFKLESPVRVTTRG